eukprot:TRINITY_DN5260_c0_g1_i3.p2 TRINITY_DN5260_c0_g1~~TRINITY_DN5260_c0_g1_i3.p2  ORF type:complete len:562 (+),score=107.91 TRINITY_DN5260_c0_g1_i3:74-1687(+)
MRLLPMLLLLTALLALCCDHARAQLSPSASKWALLAHSEVGPDRPVRLRFALAQRNLHLLEQLLSNVSTPTHEQYLQFWSVDEVDALVAPDPAHVRQLTAYLKQLGASEYRLSPSGCFVSAALPAHIIESTFNVQLGVFAHGGEHIVRSTAPYTLPEELGGAVTAVDFLSDFPLRRSKEELIAKYPGDDITPPVIKQLYNITATGSYNPNAAQAVAEFEEAYFYPSDLSTFEDKYGLPQQAIEKIVGINAPNTGYLGEASLDVQYIVGVGTNIPTWVWSQRPFDLVQWAENVTHTPGAPWIHSVSWGSAESGFSKTTLNQTNIAFQKMGVLGFSVFAASGDSGTGRQGFGTCKSFAPNFPASSPFLTSVGGTYLENGEETCVDFSGGGFSSEFARPSYQDAAVATYFTNYSSQMPNSKYYNASGRGIPDVSALATNFQVVIQNSWGELSGTSAATPTFAAVMALMQDARAAQGKGPLGFLNPLLYQWAEVGTDIVAGNNAQPLCKEGFPAVQGWDACSGFGTPQYSTLFDLAVIQTP